MQIGYTSDAYFPEGKKVTTTNIIKKIIDAYQTEGKAGNQYGKVSA